MDKKAANRAKSFVYFGGGCTSISDLGYLYIVGFVLSLFSFAVGVSHQSYLIMISAVVWNLAYLGFYFVLRCKKIKKTFALGFLASGITGTLISLLFWLLLASCFIAVYPENGLKYSLWVLFFYLLFSALFILFIAVSATGDAFRKMKSSNKGHKFIFNNALFASIIPVCGTLGMMVSKILRDSAANPSIKFIVLYLCLLLSIFIPALGHINFVQYYYCKKYNITCNRKGEEGAPWLEYIPREKKVKEKKPFRSLSLPKKIVRVILWSFLITFAVFVVGILVLYVLSLIF